MNYSLEHNGSSELIFRDQYPFPIAFLFAHRILSTDDAEKCVRGIAHSFENSLRYLIPNCRP
jgi:hypothetical protein